MINYLIAILISVFFLELIIKLKFLKNINSIINAYKKLFLIIKKINIEIENEKIYFEILKSLLYESTKFFLKIAFIIFIFFVIYKVKINFFLFLFSKNGLLISSLTGIIYMKIKKIYETKL